MKQKILYWAALSLTWIGVIGLIVLFYWLDHLRFNV